MADMIPVIIRVASSKVGKNDWLYATAKDNFGANTNKCNQFATMAVQWVRAIISVVLCLIIRPC